MSQEPAQYGHSADAHQAYQQQGYPPSYPPPTNAMAILSLVFVFVFWPLAIIFGHVARGQIARTGESGSGLATAGLVIGYVLLGLTVIAIVGVILVVAAVVP